MSFRLVLVQNKRIDSFPRSIQMFNQVSPGQAHSWSVTIHNCLSIICYRLNMSTSLILYSFLKLVELCKISTCYISYLVNFLQLIIRSSGRCSSSRSRIFAAEVFFVCDIHGHELVIFKSDINNFLLLRCFQFRVFEIGV